MVKRKHILHLALVVILILFSFQKSLSQLNRVEITSAYIYNFANLSSSPKQLTLPTYTIVLVSENQSLVNELKKMAFTNTIRNKKIEVIVANNDFINYETACLIFVGSDKNQFYQSVFNKSRLNQVLLVSENYVEKREILLNLYDTGNGSLAFEMNKGNLFERNISINDEILLMGGNVIDLFELYVESQEKQTKITHELSVAQKQLSLAENKLKTLEQQIFETKKEIITQQKLMAKQKNENLLLVNTIKNNQQEITLQKEGLLNNKNVLELITNEHNLLSTVLKEQQIKIEAGNLVLTNQLKQIELKNKEVATKQKSISKQEETIFYQRLIVAGFTVLLIVVIVLFILLLKYNLERKNKNELIELQKQTLSKRNVSLRISLKEIKKIQDKLIQSEKMASLGVLSAGIAHEINNPINFVFAGINSLIKDFKDVEPIILEVASINHKNIAEKIQKIEQLKIDNYFDEAVESIPFIIKDIKLGAERIVEIVKGLQSFSRTDAGELSDFNIHEGIETSLILLKNKYKNRIKIIKEFDSKIPVIKCYTSKIDQVLLNVLSNAIQAIQDTGEIHIKTEHSKKNVVITVKDSGCGMSKEVKEKVFDPFYTTKKVGEGVGLGLSISYGIINDHKGNIKIESEINKGTAFIISLPLSEKL